MNASIAADPIGSLIIGLIMITIFGLVFRFSMRNAERGSSSVANS